MNEFYLNIDPTRKNFLIVTKERDGRVHIIHDCKTDDELAEVCDYHEYARMSGLEVGQSCECPDMTGCYALRIT